jgi:hypothetical protein
MLFEIQRSTAIRALPDAIGIEKSIRHTPSSLKKLHGGHLTAYFPLAL